MHFREATIEDIPALAALRAAEWETIDYWTRRIRGYMNGTLNPQKALAPRVLIVAEDENEIQGFIAGHLTRRFHCDGEVQWINVAPDARRSGIASALLQQLALWFAMHGARRVCVDVDPDNPAGRAFYQRHGAAPLNPHWLVWDDITLTK